MKLAILVIAVVGLIESSPKLVAFQ